VALNVLEVEPAGTVADVGVVNSELLSETVTLVPPLGAALVRVTVQTLVALEARLVGLQASAERATGAARAMVTFWEAPFSVAVTVAF